MPTVLSCGEGDLYWFFYVLLNILQLLIWEDTTVTQAIAGK